METGVLPPLRESHRLKLDSAGQTVKIGDIVSDMYEKEDGSRSRAD